MLGFLELGRHSLHYRVTGEIERAFADGRVVGEGSPGDGDLFLTKSEVVQIVNGEEEVAEEDFLGRKERDRVVEEELDLTWPLQDAGALGLTHELAGLAAHGPARQEQFGADVLSLEPKVDLNNARAKCNRDTIFMGGVDTVTTLLMNDADEVRQACEKAMAEGIQILAPGCAVAPGTPTDNLRSMVKTAEKRPVQNA